MNKGTYAFILRLPVDKEIDIGRLGRFHFHEGFYIYVGSAFGPGGLKGRLGHHLKQARSPRWHIDYLRMESLPEEAWVHAGDMKREHIWASSMGALKGASVPAPGFGSSDCRCRTHLFCFNRKPAIRAFEKLIPRERGDTGKPHRILFKTVSL
jgi:Uri superfamily endonuclease